MDMSYSTKISGNVRVGEITVYAVGRGPTIEVAETRQHQMAERLVASPGAVRIDEESSGSYAIRTPQKA